MYEVDQNLQSVESHPGDATVPGPPFSPRQNGHAATQDAQGPLDQPWQALLDSAGEGIWGVDLEGRCTFVNRAALGMLGFEAEELVGSNMHEMVHHHYIDGSSYPAENCCVYNVFRKNRPFSNQVDHIFRKDGTHFWTEMSAQPILQEGELRGAVVTFRDITQTRMAEDALRRSEKLAAVGQLASSTSSAILKPWTKPAPTPRSPSPSWSASPTSPSRPSASIAGRPRSRPSTSKTLSPPSCASTLRVSPPATLT
jgi:PAS domain S-box-containing protein